mmetsp:Transcript_68771/g.157779  ORF Transcript_68771/g.157779 Transcript_68771/m.157779 type:complete len:261 (-) Transcript_68771:962-1744(-)
MRTSNALTWWLASFRSLDRPAAPSGSCIPWMPVTRHVSSGVLRNWSAVLVMTLSMSKFFFHTRLEQEGDRNHAVSGPEFPLGTDRVVGMTENLRVLQAGLHSVDLVRHRVRSGLPALGARPQGYRSFPVQQPVLPLTHHLEIGVPKQVYLQLTRRPLAQLADALGVGRPAADLDQAIALHDSLCVGFAPFIDLVHSHALSVDSKSAVLHVSREFGANLPRGGQIKGPFAAKSAVIPTTLVHDAPFAAEFLQLLVVVVDSV